MASLDNQPKPVQASSFCYVEHLGSRDGCEGSQWLSQLSLPLSDDCRCFVVVLCLDSHHIMQAVTRSFPSHSFLLSVHSILGSLSEYWKSVKKLLINALTGLDSGASPGRWYQPIDRTLIKPTRLCRGVVLDSGRSADASSHYMRGLHMVSRYSWLNGQPDIMPWYVTWYWQ
jgi:hypothetical protein